MIKELILKKSEKEIILIFGNKFENEILYKKEFENLERENANFKFLPIVSRPTENWKGRTGHVQKNFDVIDPLNSNFFICGLPKMFNNVKEKLLILGVDEKDIFHEVFC